MLITAETIGVTHPFQLVTQKNWRPSSIVRMSTPITAAAEIALCRKNLVSTAVVAPETCFAPRPAAVWYDGINLVLLVKMRSQKCVHLMR